MLIGGMVPLGLIRTFRTLWISGRTGGGKTSLAFRFGYDLMNSGFCKHLVSNIPSVWTEDMWSIEPGPNWMLDTVVILDEAGLYMRMSKDADEYISFCRKMNLVFILPSVKKPAPVMRDFVIERVWNASMIGLPVWIYKYFLTTAGYRDEAKFWWVNPSEVFGLFDTDAKPVDDMGIAEWIGYWKEQAVSEYYGKQGRERGAGKRSAAVVSGVEESGGAAGEFMAASEEFSEAAAVMAMAARRQAKRRR